MKLSRRQFLKLAGMTAATALGLGCTTNNTPHQPTHTTTPQHAYTPTQDHAPASIDTRITQAIDTTQGNIVTTLEIYAPQKPTITIKQPYTQTIEPKPRGDKWTANITQQKPTDYQVVIQAGDQTREYTLEGLIPTQQYNTLAGIQDTLDQMYHQLLRDQRLGQSLQDKKTVYQKSTEYASKQTPQNTEAIMATLALATATTTKKLPENPQEIYNLIKKTSQNPRLYSGFDTYSWTDAYERELKIYTHNLPEALWLQARALHEIEKKHPDAATRYAHLVSNNTSWWAHIHQLLNDWNGAGYIWMGDISRVEGKERMTITHPDYLDLAVTSADWYITQHKKGKAFFPVDDQTLEQKYSKKEDIALVLQQLVKTPAKTWGRITPDTPPSTNYTYGFDAFKTFWHYHVPLARKLADKMLETWPLSKGYNGKVSFYIVIGDAAYHGELYSMARLVGADNVTTPEELTNHPIAKLLNSNDESPDMEDEYFKKYPHAPNVVLSQNSPQWEWLKFIYSAGQGGRMYAQEVGWPKERHDEREMYQEVMPAVASAVVFPLVPQPPIGLFRREYGTSVDDRVASMLRQRYGNDLVIGPGNTVGPFISKQAAKKDWEITKAMGVCPDGQALPEKPGIAIIWPRSTLKEIPGPQQGQYYLVRL